MRHQMSFVYNFLSPNVNVLEKNSSGNVVPFVKTNTRHPLKTSIFLT